MDQTSLNPKSFYNNLYVFFAATVVGLIPSIGILIYGPTPNKEETLVIAISTILAFATVHYFYRFLHKFYFFRSHFYSISKLEGTWLQVFESGNINADFAIIWIKYCQLNHQVNFVGNTFKFEEFKVNVSANTYASFHSNGLILDTRKHILTYAWQTEEFFGKEVANDKVYHTYGTGRWHFKPKFKRYTRAVGSFLRDADNPTRHVHQSWKIDKKILNIPSIRARMTETLVTKRTKKTANSSVYVSKSNKALIEEALSALT